MILEAGPAKSNEFSAVPKSEAVKGSAVVVAPSTIVVAVMGSPVAVLTSKIVPPANPFKFSIVIPAVELMMSVVLPVISWPLPKVTTACDEELAQTSAIAVYNDSCI